MTHHNHASDANLAYAEFELKLQQAASEYYARELTDERIKQLARSTGPASLKRTVPDPQAEDDAAQAEYLRQERRKKITRRAVRDFAGLLLCLAFWAWLLLVVMK